MGHEVCHHHVFRGTECHYESNWHRWGRWLFLGLILFVFLFIIFPLLACLLIRRRRKSKRNLVEPKREMEQGNATYTGQSNGHTNGVTNGHTNEHTNGHTNGQPMTGQTLNGQFDSGYYQQSYPSHPGAA